MRKAVMGLRKGKTIIENTLPFASEYFKTFPEHRVKTGIEEWLIEKAIFTPKGIALFSNRFTVFVFKSAPDFLILGTLIEELTKEQECTFALIFQFPDTNIRYNWDYDISTHEDNKGWWIETQEEVRYEFKCERNYREEDFVKEVPEDAQDVVNLLRNKAKGITGAPIEEQEKSPSKSIPKFRN